MAPSGSRFAFSFASASLSLTDFGAATDGALEKWECAVDDAADPLLPLKLDEKLLKLLLLLPPPNALLEPPPKLDDFVVVAFVIVAVSKSRSSSPPQLSSPQPLSAPALSDVKANDVADGLGLGGVVVVVRETLSFIPPPLDDENDDGCG